jgi:type II restriction enzyme
MTSDLAAAYQSGSQRTRVVTEFWGERNLYCPNCSSPKLNRLANNAKASDFCCPDCRSWYQLKGQKTRIGRSIPDGAYAAMMAAIRKDETPNFLFMHYDLASWTIQNLLLIPHFAFPPSAIVKRPALSETARRAGWVGCTISLDRIPADARISIVQERQVIPADAVRAQFRKVKPLEKIAVGKRGWTLEVLNAVRELGKQRFTLGAIYQFEPRFKQLYPGNNTIRYKIRQQLQQLRDAGFIRFLQPGVYESVECGMRSAE